jgi:type IX secretion system PorP/SprF family membrane protein
MKNKIINTVLLFFVILNISQAQSDPKLSNFIFSPLTYNPAYAGSYQGMSISSVYSSQWVGFDGAPQTMFLSGHTKFDDRVGMGIDFMNDKVGATNESRFIGNYAYHLDVNYDWKLSMGIKGGVSSYAIDYSLLSIYNPSEFNDTKESVSVFSPIVGAGFYIHNESFFAGFSIPNFLKFKKIDAYKNTEVNSAINYFLTTGYKFNLEGDIVLQPTILARVINGAPISVIPAVNLNWNDTIFASINYENNVSLGAFAGYRFMEKFTLGYSYDVSTNNFNRYNGGIHSLFLNFRLENWWRADTHSNFTF